MVNENKHLVVFQDKKIRRVFHNGKWHFSVVDVVGILSESEDARNYWKVLKHRLLEEGSEVVTNCNQLKSQKQKTAKDMMNVLLLPKKEELLREMQELHLRKRLARKS